MVISTHVLRMEDDMDTYAADIQKAMISTHVLRMEDDGLAEYYSANLAQFQPTSSAWRTTINCIDLTYLIFISTHVLRMEDDNLGT